MFQGLRTVIYFVPDLEKATVWYSALLGMDPYFAEAYYVGFNVGGYELGLHPNEAKEGSSTPPPAMTYWGVPNAAEAMAHLLENGAAQYEAVQDVGGGILLGAVKDPFGNIVGVIENPYFKLASAG